MAHGRRRGSMTVTTCVMVFIGCGGGDADSTTPQSVGGVTDIVDLERRDLEAASAWLQVIDEAQAELEQCADAARPFVRKSLNPRAGKLDVVGTFVVHDGTARFSGAQLLGEVPEVPSLGPCIERALAHRVIHGVKGRFSGSLRVHLCIQRDRPSLVMER